MYEQNIKSTSSSSSVCSARTLLVCLHVSAPNTKQAASTPYKQLSSVCSLRWGAEAQHLGGGKNLSKVKQSSENVLKRIPGGSPSVLWTSLLKNQAMHDPLVWERTARYSYCRSGGGGGAVACCNRVAHVYTESCGVITTRLALP